MDTQPGYQQVTASEFVRQFGIWQDRARDEPVYIVHRGRPKLVLLSVEIMEALCDRGEPVGVIADGQVAALIDSYDESVILFDDEAIITHANRAARARFAFAIEGESIDGLLARGNVFIASLVRRVLQSGTSEYLQIPSPDRPGHELFLKIDALPSGCILVARDASALEELRHCQARSAALLAAVEATGETAAFRLNNRLALVEPRPALAKLMGAAIEHLSGTRLSTFVDIADRQRVSDLIYQVFDTGGSVTTQIDVLVEGGRKKRAALSLAGTEGLAQRAEITGTLTLLQ